MNFKKRKISIFALSGKAGSGKNLVARLIEEYYSNKKSIILSYGDYIKQIAKKVSVWDGSEDNKPRDLLQQLGIELIKNKIDNRLLIDRMLEDIEIFSYFYDIIIVSDVRLLDEIKSLKENFKDIISIRIVRNDYNSNMTEEEQRHITEVDLDNYTSFDYTIINNNNYINLKNQMNQILNEVKV